MGVCLSRCGETHHEEAGGGPAVVISHRKYSFDNNTESLKKFLHLHAAVDTGKKSALSSRRVSLEESGLVIPHSSELFSLPVLDPDRSSFAISPSPSQASRTSATSRVANSSPKSRSSCSAWGGRSGAGCRNRIRPAPRSTGAEHDLAAHQRLIEAIARLERLNDGKQLGLPGSSCSDPHKDTTQASQLPTSRSRHVRHYQLPIPTYTCEESDSDEMFTFFEATSSSDLQVRKKPSLITTSLYQLVQSPRIENPFPVAEKALDIPVAGNPISKPNPVRQSTEQSKTVVTNIESADAGFESMGVEKGDARAARGALTDIDMNGVATLKKWSSLERSPRALKGFRRRLSRSFDSRERAIVHVDFDYLLRNAPLAPSRLSNVFSESNTTTTAQASTLIDAMGTKELGLFPGTSISSCPDIKLEQLALCDQDGENSIAEFLDTSTVELTTSEQCQSPPVMPVTFDGSLLTVQVADESAITSADSCHRGPESLDKNPSPVEVADNSELPSLEELLDEDQSLSTLASAESSFREPDNLDNALEDSETSARCQETLLPESWNECTESPSPSQGSPCPTETGVEVPDYYLIPDTSHSEVGNSQKFLSKAFCSLLKLLLITDTVHTVHKCSAPLDQDEKMGSLQEASPALQ